MATKSRVLKFNTLKRSDPVGLEDREKFWSQLEFQANLVVEEAKEFLEAVESRDLENAVKEACDVDYVYTYAEVLLEHAGVNMGVAKDMVAMNNDQKYTLSEELAEQSAYALEEDGVETYIDEVEWEGDTIYMVKRWGDGKILKLLEHVEPNVSATIPDNTLKVLSENLGEGV